MYRAMKVKRREGEREREEGRERKSDWIPSASAVRNEIFEPDPVVPWVQAFVTSQTTSKTRTVPSDGGSLGEGEAVSTLKGGDLAVGELSA